MRELEPVDGIKERVGSVRACRWVTQSKGVRACRWDNTE